MPSDSPNFTVITNVSGVQDLTGKYAGRLHCVSLLSEVLRIWCDLPVGARILLVLDEPESTLRGGSTRGVVDFSVFRFMIRKLGICKMEIWHNESDQYKGLREDTSEQVFRIKKDTQDAFTITRRMGDQMIRQRVENVPKDCGLSFATEGMATIGMDVDIAAIVMRIGKLWRPADIKAEVRRALEDPSIYHPQFQSKDAVAQAVAARRGDQRKRDEERVQAILADQAKYRARRGQGFDHNIIRRSFDLTDREADSLALLAERRWNEIRPRTALEQAVARIQQDPEAFLTAARRSYDPGRIARAFGLPRNVARQAAAEAWKLREPQP